MKDVEKVFKHELEKSAAEVMEQVKAHMEGQINLSEVEKSIVHDRVECDGCGSFPIVGPRYKCSVCRNFDFCSKCESLHDHEHPFLKLNDPNDEPSSILTGICEDHPLAQSAHFDLEND